MLDVRPVWISCRCLKRLSRARPRPLSSSPCVRTPSRVDFPESTFPSTATRRSKNCLDPKQQDGGEGQYFILDIEMKHFWSRLSSGQTWRYLEDRISPADHQEPFERALLQFFECFCPSRNPPPSLGGEWCQLRLWTEREKRDLIRQMTTNNTLRSKEPHQNVSC